MTDNNTPPASQNDDAGSAFDPNQLRNAIKAFKKRLKMARLDAESGLGHGATSGGKRSGIVAIVPPDHYPQAVWDELWRQGKLRRAGQGMYELAEEAARD